MLRGPQAFGDLVADAQGIALRQLVLTPDSLLQAATAHELHGEVKVALIIAHGVELDDVRMRDAGGDERLLAKLRQTSLIPAVGAVENFQRHPAAERLVLRLEHAAHAALSDLAHDHEMVEPPPHPHHLAAKRTF